MTGAGLRRLLATTAMRRVSRSGRSPGGWDGPRPPSRRTCTTRLTLTKNLWIARALTPASTLRAPAYERFPGHKVAPASAEYPGRHARRRNLGATPRDTTRRNPSPPAGFSCASAGCPAPPEDLGPMLDRVTERRRAAATRPPLPRPGGSGNRRDRSPARLRRGGCRGHRGDVAVLAADQQRPWAVASVAMSRLT